MANSNWVIVEHSATIQGIDYATVFIENMQRMADEHEARNRMAYLMQHRLYPEAKSVIAAIGPALALRWTPETNALYRVMWLHLCKVKDRNPQLDDYRYYAYPDSWRLRAVALSSYVRALVLEQWLIDAYADQAY